MGKSADEDRRDRQAARQRKQRGRGAKRTAGGSVVEYVPLSDVARDSAERQRRQASLTADHERAVIFFAAYVAAEVDAIVLAIKYTGAAQLKSSVPGFSRIVFELKKHFRNTSVKWELQPFGIVFGVQK